MVKKTVSKLFLVISLFAVFITTQSFPHENILVEGKGFETLMVGHSKVEDVILILGKPNSIEQTKAEYRKNYFYPKIGLKINFHDDTLNTISTLANFDGNTSKGISLQSSLEDVEKIYGLPLVAPGRTKDNATTWVYDGVIFWINRSWIFNLFDEIEKIVIFDESFRRSKK